MNEVTNRQQQVRDLISKKKDRKCGHVHYRFTLFDYDPPINFAVNSWTKPDNYDYTKISGLRVLFPNKTKMFDHLRTTPKRPQTLHVGFLRGPAPARQPRWKEWDTVESLPVFYINRDSRNLGSIVAAAARYRTWIDELRGWSAPRVISADDMLFSMLAFLKTVVYREK
jgi:hypothetical protein